MMADEVYNKDAEVKRWFDRFWRGEVFDPDNIFTTLASDHRNGLPCRAGRLFCGSFHICLRAVFDDDIAWILRVPLPFHIQSEKLRYFSA